MSDNTITNVGLTVFGSVIALAIQTALKRINLQTKEKEAFIELTQKMRSDFDDTRRDLDRLKEKDEDREQKYIQIKSENQNLRQELDDIRSQWLRDVAYVNVLTESNRDLTEQYKVATAEIENLRQEVADCRERV